MINRSFIILLIILVFSLLIISGCGEVEVEEEICIDGETGEFLSLSEAREIALASDCVEQGALKEQHFCNEYTGTWWLDLDIEMEGCSPACVVNIVTKETEINWRCTGLRE